MEWQRSSYCAGGACVEVAVEAGAVLVRDGKDPYGPVLTFTAAEWAAFVAGVQAGEAVSSGG
jgi:predicted secreted Zn-dependent protease